MRKLSGSDSTYSSHNIFDDLGQSFQATPPLDRLRSSELNEAF